MADLSDYLGHVLCEVTRARVMADLAAVRTAVDYAGDERGLMQRFPVPRLRLSGVEVTVPVVVKGIPAGYSETTSTDPRIFARMLVEDLGPALKGQGLTIDTAEITKLILQDPALSKGRLADDLPDALSSRIYERIKPEKKVTAGEKAGGDRLTSVERFKIVTSIIRGQILKALEALPRTPVGIAVDGTTAAAKEVSDAGLLCSVKLLIREEALEIMLESKMEPPAEPPPEPPAKVSKIRMLVPE